MTNYKENTTNHSPSNLDEEGEKENLNKSAADVKEQSQEDDKEKEQIKEPEEKKEHAAAKEEKHKRKRKIIKSTIISVIIIGLAVGASFLGPANMEPGVYDVQLNIVYGGNNYSTSFDLTMADEADTLKVEYYRTLDSNLSCIITTNEAFESKTNSKVAFNVGLVDGNNNSISDLELNYFDGKIVGDGMDRKFRPTKIATTYSSLLDQEISSAGFSMAIPYKAGIALALLVLIAGLWITEILPTVVPSFLVPIISVITGISGATDALQPFFSPVIALFLGGFVLAEALKKHNLDRRLALGIVSKSSIRPPILILTLMGVSAFLSMWMSNTASTAVMIPIAVAMVDQIESNKNRAAGKAGGFKKALVLGIGYAATTGGIASVIGTPANPIAVDGLKDIGIEISFLKWFGYGLPFVIIMLLIIWGYLLFVFKPKVPKEDLKNAKIVFDDELDKLGKMNQKQWTTVGVFVITIGLWLTSEFHHISSGIVALIAVVLIFSTDILKPKDIKNINWNALFLFGGGLSLGDALISTGIGDWIASNMGIIEGKHYILIAFIVGGLSLLVTAVASNTASAAMLVPLVIPIAISLQIDPILLAVIAAMGASVDYALVFGTPPTMISYSTGYFKVKEIFKTGIVLDFIGIILLSTVSVFLWVLFGLITI
jgi:sodium-dependent dicarboxylate transporter 2/3/5